MPRRNPRPITLMFYDDGSRTRPLSHWFRSLRVTRDDFAGFERSNEEYSPLLKGTDEAPSNGNAKPMPDGKPRRRTTGGTAFSGMKQTLVAAYPLDSGNLLTVPPLSQGYLSIWLPIWYAPPRTIEISANEPQDYDPKVQYIARGLRDYGLFCNSLVEAA